MQSLREVTVSLLAELLYTELHDPYSGNGPGERRVGGWARCAKEQLQGGWGDPGSDQTWIQSGTVYSSVQSVSCIWFLATPWTAALQASLSITNSELAQTHHVHWVCDASNHLILLSPSGGDGAVYTERLWQPILFWAPFKVSPCLRDKGCTSK